MSSRLHSPGFARHLDVPELRSAALIVIDFQRVFTDRGSPAFLPGAPGALRCARHLVRSFRTAGLPVAFTRHAHLEPPQGPGLASWWSHFILDTDPNSALDESLTPLPPEPVYRKTQYSTFHRTGLSAWLAHRRVNRLVLCGVMTHVCVDTTARDAFSRGFDVIVASDACASKSQELHDASLLCLSHAVARVVSVRRIVATLPGGAR